MVKLRTLQIWWSEFNGRFFQGALHSIPIRITRSRRYWGHYSGGPPAAIYIGRNLNKTIEDFRDTLLHEMVHQYLDERRVTESSDHGPIFRQEYLRVQGKEYVDLD